MTYPALGITDSYHHPPVKWNAGSRFFTFAVINTTDNQDVFYNPNVTSTIWRVSVDGSATQLATITGMALDHTFSPDLEQVAFMRVSPKGPPLREMHFADIHDTWDVIYDERDRVTFRQWNPNGEAAGFIFFNGSDNPHIGRLCQDSVPLPTGSESDSPTQQVNWHVNWVDDTRYLYASEPKATLYLRSVEGSQKLVGQMDPEKFLGITGLLMFYDFH